MAPQVVGSPSFKEVKSLLPYISKKQVYWFSEYNSGGSKYDFNTGVGGQNLGILLVDDNLTSTKSNKLNYHLLKVIS